MKAKKFLRAFLRKLKSPIAKRFRITLTLRDADGRFLHAATVKKVSCYYGNKSIDIQGVALGTFHSGGDPAEVPEELEI